MRKLGFRVVWLVSLGSFFACEDNQGAALYCDVYVERLRQCGVIGEGRFEGCENYLDEAEACETQCLEKAKCSEISKLMCPSGFEATPLDRCLWSCVGTATFECGSGEFVGEYNRCNGFADCSDASDEENCTVAEEERAVTSRCRNVDERYSWDVQCDDVQDCSDGSDEFGCTVALECETLSGSEEIRQVLYCDGVEDCLDGSDEPEGCTERILVCQ